MRSGSSSALFTLIFFGVTLTTETAFFTVNPCENTAVVGNLYLAYFTFDEGLHVVFPSFFAR
jgi:hypothetical protein